MTKPRRNGSGRVLTTDPGMRIIRHMDAGYDEAKEFAVKRNIPIPMETR